MSYLGGGRPYDPRHGGGQEQRYHDRGRQSYPPHQQSHGRDRSRGPPRGGSGDRGGGFRPRRQDDEDYEVQTNYFKVMMNEEQRYSVEYRATIYAARQIKKGLSGEPLDTPRYVFREKRGDNNEFVPGSRVEVTMEKGATQKTEDIMMQLHRGLAQQYPPQFIATDGGSLVFASRPLFDAGDVAQEEQQTVAPLTLGTASGMQDPPRSMRFPVSVSKDCREDDYFADEMPKTHFIVVLQEIGPLYYKRSGESTWPLQDNQVEKFNQFLNILGRTSMLRNGCRSFMSKSRSLYFPQADQENLARDTRGFSIPENAIEAPLLGMNQSSRASEGKQFYYARNTIMTNFHLSKNKVRNSPEYRKIPILDPQNGMIAGVRFGGGPTNQPVPEQYRDNIQAALDKLQFHVIFRSKLPEERKKDIHAKYQGTRSPEEIEAIIERSESKDFVRPYTWMRQRNPGAPEPLIIWSADDPNEYSFEYKGSNVTVYTYMERHHGIRLQYPKMPIVQTRYGYYPVEFMFQALGIVKGADDDEYKNTVLKYHDENAGERKIPHIKRVVQLLDTSLEREFGFEISSEPVTQMAKLLAEPKLEFGGNCTQDVSNGSWNLVQRGQALEFERPADFSSYCVVDFVGDTAHRLVTGALNRAASHGLQNVQYQKEYRTVTQAVTVTARLGNQANMVQQVHESVCCAIKRAKDFFLYDRTNFFNSRRIMFKTYIVHPSGVPTKCLLYPCGSEQLGIIYPVNISPVTHTVRVYGELHEARMHAVCKTRTGEQLSVDLFDFRWHSELPSNDNAEYGLHWEARRQDGGAWERVSFQAYHWRLVRNGIITEHEVQSDAVESSIQCDGTWKIDCPSIVFVLLPDKEKERYQLVKLSTNFYHGVQSQCLVWETFQRQERGRSGPDQYFSNVAQKLNTKLSNSINKAQAWRISDYRHARGMPWVTDETMVVGVAMSRGSGRESKTVVAATVALVDESGSCMSNGFKVDVQSNPDVVETQVMRSVFMVLTLLLVEHTKKFPKKVLLFRDGSSEGNFPALLENEVPGARQGLLDAWETWHDESSATVFAPPKLTYVVCVNQHNVQIVPSGGNGVGRSVKNVPSGTCVNDVIVAFSNVDIGNDFLLTAQGGLKGTSKPVYYRVLIKEDDVLTRDVLQAVVYGLSFNYGSATKATRRLSVTQYSKRLAEQFLSYLPYIDGGGRREGIEGMPVLVFPVRGDSGAFRSDQDEEASDLLPGFSVREESGDWCPPLRPHLAS